MAFEKKSKQVAPKEAVVVSTVVETPAPEVSNKVRVYAKVPPFVDLITDTRILGEAVEVEMHPWLQAQVDVGHLIKA